jgi:hypothetical protein
MDIHSVLQKLEVPVEAPAWQAALLSQLENIEIVDEPVRSVGAIPPNEQRVRKRI